MAVSFSCRCKPKDKTKWRVSDRNCHHSAFSGYHWTYSEYSTVHCTECNAVGRTKAAYVSGLPDAVRNTETGRIE